MGSPKMKGKKDSGKEGGAKDGDKIATQSEPAKGDTGEPPGDNPASSLRKRRGRMLPLSRKKSDSPPEVPQDKPDHPSEDNEGIEDSSHEVDQVDSKDTIEDSQEDEDISQEHSDSDSGSSEHTEDEDDDTDVLPATLPNGTEVSVTIIVDNRSFDPSNSIDSPVGRDGNRYYCQVCKDVGEIVCCDGCPRAYHPKCIPKGNPSRVAIENDEEPWYCPRCMAKGGAELSPGNRRADGRASRSVKRRCSECQQSGGDNPMEPCEGCGVYLHHPSCRKDQEGGDGEDDNGPVLCSNCRAEEVVIREEGELVQQKRSADSSETEDEETSQQGRRRLRRRASIDTEDDDISQDHLEEGKPGKRKRSMSETDKPAKKKRGRPPLTKEEKEERARERAWLKEKKRKKKKKKKKKKRKRLHSIGSESMEPSAIDDDNEQMPAPSLMSTGGLVKATPAFFFFINDYRFKIERALARKHRYFNRLPKGMERNQLIAREAALWWVKLRPSDHQRYLNMSMRDFEERVIEWKEEKSIRDMTMAGAIHGTGEDMGLLQGAAAERSTGSTAEDEMLTYQNYQRLYRDTSVGSKPFAPEQGKSNNRILLELLQDMRFHPLPMLTANRDDGEPGQMDYSKMSIPHFEMHGPVATSVGDECLGCSRGWNHFCPVLKRRLPAVEHRARLQPPLSSLMATRVGLGLRPRGPTGVDDHAQYTDDLLWRTAEPFSEKATTEAIEAKKLPPISSYSLDHPSSRTDDVVNFVEEALAMEVPEPPRPLASSTSSGSSKRSLSRGALPMHGRKRRGAGSTGRELNKCGRCRTVIPSDTGCIQCRRAQLVINMSKQHPSGKGSKVQTTMLGRLSTKVTNFEEMSEGDQATSNMMLKMRWAPNAVLPPQKALAPEHHPHGDDESDDSSGVEFLSDDEASIAMSMVDLARQYKRKIDAEDGNNIVVDERESTEKSDIQVSSSNDLDGNAETSTHARAPKRQRTTRRTTALASVAATSDPDRQKIAEKHQAEAAQLNKRCLSVATCGILLALLRRDPLLLFAEPVPANVEAYSKIVRNPIDFSKIRSKVLNESYNSLGAFVSDARLLCTNALAYNPAGTIYAKTAKELYDVLEVMQKRASDWMQAIKNAHASSFAWRGPESTSGGLRFDHHGIETEDDPFRELRRSWPEAVELLESGDWLRNQIASDFMRTKENETAYYGSMAIRRAAAAAGASLAPYPDTVGDHNPVVRRSHVEDEALRTAINKSVAETTDPIQLKDCPTWREEAILRILRRVQSRRVEGSIASENGCARCDGIRIEQKAKMAMRADSVRWGRNRRRGEAETIPRVAESRLPLSTGLGSEKVREQIEKKKQEKKSSKEVADSIGEVGVSVRGSRIHGWGLFADQPFNKGEVVAEYVGEYVTHDVADARERMYQEQRIQDYQFRTEADIIDATMRGGHGRYINHNCNPNCIAKIVDGKEPNAHLKRVIIIAQRNIKAREEITYDYQFPLELDLEARIPCNCGEALCRGFMNWDLPEKGSKNRVVRPTRRGGNMRDRIRRLGKTRKHK